MKLGLLTAAFGELSLDEVAAWAAANGFDMLEVACWPASGAEKRRVLRCGDDRKKEGTQENEGTDHAPRIRRVPRESRKHFAWPHDLRAHGGRISPAAV